MLYGYFSDSGEIVAPVQMCTRFKDIGAWHTLTDKERSVHAWHPCVVIDEGQDLRLFRRIESEREFSEGVITVRYRYFPKQLSEVQQEYLDALVLTYVECMSTFFEIGENYYCVKDLEYGVGEFFERDNLILRMTESAEITLSDLRNSLLSVRYEIQEQIRSTTNAEDVLSIDTSGKLKEIMEVKYDG